MLFYLWIGNLVNGDKSMLSTSAHTHKHNNTERVSEKNKWKFCTSSIPKQIRLFQQNSLPEKFKHSIWSPTLGMRP